MIAQVLWIDDMPVRYLTLEKDLRDKLSVTFAHGTEQVDYYLFYGKRNWDLVMVDGHMPGGISGLEVCRLYLGNYQGPILIVSGNALVAAAMSRSLTESGCTQVFVCSAAEDRKLNNTIRDLLKL